MSEVFNKTEHGLTDIIIAWDEFKAVLHPEFLGEIRVVIYTVCQGQTEAPPPLLGLVKNIFFEV